MEGKEERKEQKPKRKSGVDDQAESSPLKAANIEEVNFAQRLSPSAPVLFPPVRSPIVVTNSNIPRVALALMIQITAGLEGTSLSVGTERFKKIDDPELRKFLIEKEKKLKPLLKELKRYEWTLVTMSTSEGLGQENEAGFFGATYVNVIGMAKTQIAVCYRGPQFPCADMPLADVEENMFANVLLANQALPPIVDAALRYASEICTPERCRDDAVTNIGFSIGGSLAAVAAIVSKTECDAIESPGIVEWLRALQEKDKKYADVCQIAMSEHSKKIRFYLTQTAHILTTLRTYCGTVFMMRDSNFSEMEILEQQKLYDMIWHAKASEKAECLKKLSGSFCFQRVMAFFLKDSVEFAPVKAQYTSILTREISYLKPGKGQPLELLEKRIAALPLGKVFLNAVYFQQVRGKANFVTALFQMINQVIFGQQDKLVVGISCEYGDAPKSFKELQDAIVKTKAVKETDRLYSPPGPK